VVQPDTTGHLFYQASWITLQCQPPFRRDLSAQSRARFHPVHDLFL
jgi:hypothetical protein